MPPSFTPNHEGESSRMGSPSLLDEGQNDSTQNKPNTPQQSLIPTTVASPAPDRQEVSHCAVEDATTEPMQSSSWDEESERSPLHPPPRNASFPPQLHNEKGTSTPPQQVVPPTVSQPTPQQKLPCISVVPEDSYPTPIISNRGILLEQPFMVPLQLPSPAEQAQSSPPPQHEARFSSLHEPPITCSWPTTPTRSCSSTTTCTGIAAVPPEISIPMELSSSHHHGNREWHEDDTTTTALSTLWNSPHVTIDSSAWVRLLWQLLQRIVRIRALASGSSSATLWNTVGWKAPSQRSKLRDMLLLPRPATATTTSTVAGDGTIRGLPSFGQTCFLNATIQSLASLEAFGVYLQHVVHLVEQDQPPMLLTSSDDNDDNDNNTVVSRLLLDCLQGVNGTTAAAIQSNNGMMDTRPLLREIGLRHAQFRTMGMEQQDAQEFLTALLDSVVSEGEITSASFVYPNSFMSLPEPGSALSLLWEEDEDEVLTVVSGCKERRRKSEAATCSTQSGHSSHSGISHLDKSDVQTSTDAFSDYSSTGLTPVVSNHSTAKDSSVSATTTGDDKNSTTHAAARHLHNGIFARPEEKKQEDFELHIPKVASEEELLARFSPPPVHHVVDSHMMMDDPSLSDMSSKERPMLPTSLEIMRTTTTPLTPSPLTGWMGSSLQCRRCGHVRPIRNAPFGDWSVTPTAIADGWLQTGEKHHVTRPCRLEDCLAEYVRVERVDDVECRSCTLKMEREKMMEEIQMTEGVIEGLSAKARRQGKVDDGGQHCAALQQELFTYRCELARLDRLDVDDDAQAIFSALVDSDADNSTNPPLQRASARKCMFLTRLPAILCIHIQRRFYNPVTDTMTKVTQPVVFPEILDVAPYCAYGGVLGGNWAGSTRKNSNNHGRSAKSIPYRLQAVMEHRGNAFSGHYVCFRRDKLSTQGWLFISDHVVRPVSWAQVERSQAYMLFYEAM